MTQTTPLFTFPDECETIIARLTQHLTGVGFQVVRSFDFQRARAVYPACTCPHHGTAECDCQMIVLLIYCTTGQPISLIAHGHDGVTHVSWDAKPPFDEELGTIIRNAFTPQVKER